MSKGRIKLRNRLRDAPTLEELGAVVSSLKDTPPLVTAILAAGIVEDALERALQANLRNVTPEYWKQLTAESAPLNTFNQKILMAAALGLIDENTRHALVSIKTIRNHFAHSKRLESFNDELVRDELGKMKTKGHKRPLKFEDKNEGGRRAYAAACLIIGVRLYKKVVKINKRRAAALAKLPPHSVPPQSNPQNDPH
jgi:hypothetical protein